MQKLAVEQGIRFLEINGFTSITGCNKSVLLLEHLIPTQPVPGSANMMNPFDGCLEMFKCST